jgi:hypothetical protein
MISLSEKTTIDSLFIPKKVWKTFTEQEMENYIEALFNHYRSRGYPYYSTEKKDRDRNFETLLKYNFTRLIDEKNLCIKQSMHALGLVWSYFPHHIHVQCGKLRTPYETFYQDDIFRKAIRKRIQIGDNMSDAGIRKICKIYTGSQSVSNFRPTAAAAIYHQFAPQNAVVYDMSAGFGGRLMGAIRAENVTRYIGVDPCDETYCGLVKLSKDYGRQKKIELHKIGSEIFMPESNSLDLAFSSPPYFDQEKYSTEDTQSYIKYPTKESWCNEFMCLTLKNIYKGLKPRRFSVINISRDLSSDIVSVALKVGFIHINTWKLSLSNLSGAGWKEEPLLVFLKQ